MIVSDAGVACESGRGSARMVGPNISSRNSQMCVNSIAVLCCEHPFEGDRKRPTYEFDVALVPAEISISPFFKTIGSRFYVAKENPKSIRLATGETHELGESRVRHAPSKRKFRSPTARGYDIVGHPDSLPDRSHGTEPVDHRSARRRHGIGAGQIPRARLSLPISKRNTSGSRRRICSPNSKPPIRIWRRCRNLSDRRTGQAGAASPQGAIADSRVASILAIRPRKQLESPLFPPQFSAVILFWSLPSMSSRPTGMRRRDFLKGAALAGVSLVGTGYFSSLKAEESNSPNEKLNIGCIGTANQARFSIDSVKHENIVAFCDIDDKYLDKAKRDFPKAETYNDFASCSSRKESIGRGDDRHARPYSCSGHDGRAEGGQARLLRKATHAYRGRSATDRRDGRQAQTGHADGHAIHAGDNYRRVVEG